MAVGAWGDVGDVILCLFPVVLLLLLTLLPPRLPAHKTLPMAAVALYLIHLAYLGTPSDIVHSSVLSGALDTLTPLSIVASAMYLFETLKATHCMPWITAKLAQVSHNNPVAQVFLILYAFAYLIEGCSGFGTPVALAAPLMISLSHPAEETLVAGLIMNSVATIYGAAGTPLTFGFSGLDLDEDQLKTIGFRASLLNGIVGLVIPLLAARFLVTWRDMARSWFFVVMTVLTPLIVSIGLSKISLEFPTLLGGLIGLIVSSILVGFGWGVEKRTSCESRGQGLSRGDEEAASPANEGKRGRGRRRWRPPWKSREKKGPSDSSIQCTISPSDDKHTNTEDSNELLVAANVHGDQSSNTIQTDARPSIPGNRLHLTIQRNHSIWQNLIASMRLLTSIPVKKAPLSKK
eukprot:Plantae.Rhodophyta-Hildenbrandia_rubra.ctg20682.p1 GENE.Plantae.Rhodophyta-Hildenbrandia_rubra.ctg20682~~Plantae.Rhodophyta-Hildenbrandia_rubra.ctg20682.p1  ORF type:complete len:405 (-),score=37.85 Plantae.Rhodophyta-Hildenbrandia_rubra.ctg20682:370-1584(-)